MHKKESKDKYAEINVKVIPKSSRNEIISEEGRIFKIKVTSPPIDGKANKAVIAFLSKKIKIPKTDIKIVSGEKNRNKKIRFYGISKPDLLKLIA